MKSLSHYLASCLLLTAALSGAADFPTVYNSGPDAQLAPPPTPEESLAKLPLPPGFKATVFAGEPDVRNPIGMAWDGRGRLWIAENYTYAERGTKFDLRLRDRILIFEDKDGDGKFDSRKVFSEEFQRLTSVEIGRGGVWAMCPPQLLFIPDANGDDVPDGPAEVVLDGFKVPAENYHNLANGLRWGPDGWLYGRCGASAPGELGVPGTKADARIPLRGGTWRFHPTRKIVEVLTAGPMNSWGMDWDARGEAFLVNSVNGHLWHLIPGAHFQVAHTLDPNPRSYVQLDRHADHWHFDTAKGWGASRDGAANDLGGGHAHMGAMIYLADNWPESYREKLFTFNLHGRRANQEILERSGSGYIARHGEDFLLFNDGWFRGADARYGPDGGVYVLDWNDTGECHEHTGVYRTSGRIYKITYGETKTPPLTDLTKLNFGELVKLQEHPNEWFARQARRQMVDRSSQFNERYRSSSGQKNISVPNNPQLLADQREITAARLQLRDLFNRATNDVQLRALWSLNILGGEEMFIFKQLRHPNEHVRVWALRLVSDSWPLDTITSLRPGAALPGRGIGLYAPNQADQPSTLALAQFNRMAKSDSSALVRLTLASTLQRLPVMQRLPLARALVSRAEDANDHNLPLLIWYGLIPLGDAAPAALAKLGGECELPATRKYIARRLAEDLEKNPAPLNELLKVSESRSESFQADILSGLAEALRGWRKAPKPAAWDGLQVALAGSANAALRERARDLSALFGDGRALDEVKRVILDEKGDMRTRRAALETLIENRPPELQEICEQLLSVRFLNSTAVRGLALFDDPEIGKSLASSYTRFHPSERPAVIETLVSRPSFAGPLLEEIAAQRIARTDVSAFQARQIRSFDKPELTKRLAEVWGELRDTPADKQKFMATLKTELKPKVLAVADKSAGRAVFNIACASCHTLYGHGGQTGPDLTGSGRDNLDYLLDNIVDPSAVVNADFRMSIVDLKDGRTLNGLITAKTERTITLKTVTETMALEREEVESIKESALSLMPEGLLEGLTQTQIRDLFAYLMARSQVPLESEK